MSNYYTKEEIDGLVGGGFVGIIGISSKYATAPVGIFDNAPEPEYKGKLLGYFNSSYIIAYIDMTI